MITYLFRCLFFLMILFTGLLYTSNFPKRSHYLPRVVATTAFGILVSSFWAALFGGSPQPLLLYLLYQAAGFLGQFLIALFCVIFVCRCTFGPVCIWAPFSGLPSRPPAA